MTVFVLPINKHNFHAQERTLSNYLLLLFWHLLIYEILLSIILVCAFEHGYNGLQGKPTTVDTASNRHDHGEPCLTQAKDVTILSCFLRDSLWTMAVPALGKCFWPLDWAKVIASSFFPIWTHFQNQTCWKVGKDLLGFKAQDNGQLSQYDREVLLKIWLGYLLFNAYYI